MDDHEKVEKIVQTRIQTSFIYALAELEKEFGHLWGHPNDNPCTPEEQNFRKKYSRLRKRILDYGNSQMRRVVEELDPYEIEWVGLEDEE